MSIKNDDVNSLIADNMQEMQEHLNSIEGELFKSDDKMSIKFIAITLGKVMKIYANLAYYLGVFDKAPKNKN